MSAAIHIRQPATSSTAHLEHAGLARATAKQDSAKFRLEQAEKELAKRLHALEDARERRREAMAGGAVVAFDLVDLARVVAEQEAIVQDARTVSEGAAAEVERLQAKAPELEEVADLERRVAQAVDDYAAWIRDGEMLHRLIEAVRVEASGRLGNPSGLDVTLKMSIGHAAGAHRTLDEVLKSAAFARGAWRSHVG